MCSYCKEHVSWICNKCQRIEDVAHRHDQVQESLQETNSGFRDSFDTGIMHLINQG